MKKLKTYDCLVVTEDWWVGTVEANSRARAKELAEAAFNEGDFRQCQQDVLRVKAKEARS
jgi:hypothetical protein